MKNVYGSTLTLTLFGESHGPAIGAVLDGLAPGIRINRERIDLRLAQRRPSGQTSTARVEQDAYTILSGVHNGYTTGTPLCITIPNKNQHPADYHSVSGIARPGHCDYPAYSKYHGFEDPSGGGHFSGRISAAVVAAAAIVETALSAKGIRVATHLAECAGIKDRSFDASNLPEDIDRLDTAMFPVLDGRSGEKMKEAIIQAKNDLDSVGGVLETVIYGLPAGVGEPWFDTVEGLLAHGLFSVPGVKGVEFGDGFALADMRASKANDPYRIDGNGKVYTLTNHNGGIGGGISNGMPVIFRCAVKPTPSIARKQQTVDLKNMENTEIEISGRHDPCIAHRARAVVDAITVLTVADMLSVRFGTDWLAEEKEN